MQPPSDRGIYREVEYDPHALWQSCVVVILASIGTWIGFTGRTRPLSLVYAAGVGFCGWIVWSTLAYFIGVKLLPEPGTRATWGELLRAPPDSPPPPEFWPSWGSFRP